MKRRENALKRVRDALTRDRDHDAPCPAQSLTMSAGGPTCVRPSIFAGQRASRCHDSVRTVRPGSDRCNRALIAAR